jgi:hypothetical protein
LEADVARRSAIGWDDCPQPERAVAGGLSYGAEGVLDLLSS